MIENFISSLIGKSVLTKRNYRQSLEDFKDTIKKPLSKITLADAQKWFQALEARGITNTFILMHKANLEGFLKYITNGVAKVPQSEKDRLKKVLNNLNNILNNISREAPEKKNLTLTIEDTEKILTVLSDTIDAERDLDKKKRLVRSKAMLLILRSAGLRCAELCNITPNNCNFPKRTLTVTGKGVGRGKVATIFMSEKAARALQDWIDIGEIKENGRLFDLSTDMIRKLLKQWLKAAGIKEQGISVHSFRHLLITTLDERKFSLNQIMQQSRHASLTALQRYLHTPLKQADYDKVNL